MDQQIAGTDYEIAPVMTQEAIDALQKQRAGRRRYRLTRPGTLSLDGVVVTGPQLGGKVPSQMVWLAASTAAEHADSVELAP